MKSKIIYFMLGIGMLLISCTKEFEEINKDVKSTDVVPSSFIIPAAMSSIAYHYSNYDVNSNVMPVTCQHFAQVAYTDESRGIFRNGLRDSYGGNYYTALSNLNNAKKLAKDELAVDKGKPDAEADAKYNFKMLVITTLEAFSFQCITDAYGPAMYKDAFDLDNLTPAYNSQQEIYENLLVKLSEAIDNSVDAVDGLADQDLIYSGNVAAWRKFANSLLQRMAMRISDVNQSMSVTYFNKAVNENGGVFTSNNDNALFPFLPGSPNQNPIFEEFKSRVEISSSNTMVDIMKTTNDPRLYEYIYWNPGYNYDSGSYDLWEGQEYGNPSPGAYWESCYMNKYIMGRWGADKADFPGILMDYAEVEFFLAEAAVRGGGYIVTGSAKEHYDAAIDASIRFFANMLDGWFDDVYLNNMISTFQAETEVDLDLATTPEEKLFRIGTQKWVALFYQSAEAWAEARRLDAPTLNAPTSQTVADLPVRLKFSPREYIINEANVVSAIQMLNNKKDEYTTRVWWDTK